MTQHPDERPGFGRDAGGLGATERFPRKELLRRAIVGGGALSAGGLLLSACGSSETPKPSGGGGGGKPTRGGTLHVGSLPSGPAYPVLDPHNSLGWANDHRTNALFQQLTLYDRDFKDYDLLLADEFTQEKPDTWLIRVKQGVTFHDGKPLTADDVIFSIKRMATKSDSITAAALTAVDPNGFKKLDDRTVRIKLKRPDATIQDVMTSWAAGIVPENFNPRQPVGTGAFKFESYTPGRESVMSRYADYWEDGLPYADQLIVTSFEDDSARANALLSGQVNMIDFVPSSFVKPIESSDKLKILETDHMGLIAPLQMRVDQAPFNDNDVRQAIRLMIDRDAVVKQALDGHAVVGNDVFGNLDPAYDGSLPQRSQDIEKAKFLLKKAGQENLNVEIVAAQVISGVLETVQVVAEQAKQAGATINVRKVDSSVLYGPNYTKWPFAVDFFGSKRYLYAAGTINVAGAPLNATHWPDPDHRAKYMKLFTQAQGTVNVDKRNEIIREMQRMDWDAGGNIIPVYPNLVDAHASNVMGLKPNRGELPLGHPAHFKEVWVA
jgi:peptide/nickel transport system substrate-binding protein